LPWPEAADGDGFSLELISPESNPDHNEATNWQVSSVIGGSPGEEGVVIEKQTFASWLKENGGVEPNSDTDNDGRSALVEFAMGTNPRAVEDESEIFKVEMVTEELDGKEREALKITYRANKAAAGVTLEPEWSDGVGDWVSLANDEGGICKICITIPLGNFSIEFCYLYPCDKKGDAEGEAPIALPNLIRLRATLK